MKFIIFSVIFLFMTASAFGNNVEKIKANYIQQLLAQEGESIRIIDSLKSLSPEDILSYRIHTKLVHLNSVEDKHVEELLSKTRTDGSWTGINYKSRNPSQWEPREHIENMLVLAKAYKTKKSRHYQSDEIKKIIHQAFSFWFNKNLKSSNWWYNEIGIPKVMGAVLLLFEDCLTPYEREKGIEVMKRATIKYTGQNKVWLAGNVLMRGLLENNLELVKMARDSISSEIRNDRMEGIKADNSFHQHGAQQQFGNYGLSFISGMALWSEVFNGTSLAFEQCQMDIICNLVCEGYHRILWNGYMDVNSINRQYVRKAQSEKAFEVILSAIVLSVADQKNKDRYRSLIESNLVKNSLSENKTGLYHFWQSDYTIQRRPRWMASVKMASTRIIGGESGNGDNLKGYYTADGVTYIYRDGDEYYDIFPCWDWRKLPGITSYETKSPMKSLTWSSYKNKSSFVGNVNDGSTGLTAMHLNRDGLEAHKAWIFTDDYILCLGSGIRSDSGCVVTTSIEQKLQKGDFLQLENKVSKKIAKTEIENSPDVRFYHDKTGYIVLEGQKIKASVENRVGRWNEIMNIYPDSIIENCNVASLWLDHGINPNNSSYEYIIIPDASKKQVLDFDIGTIKILSNSNELQAVTLTDKNISYIVSYGDIKVKLNEEIYFETENPGLFMIKPEKNTANINVSDPTQTLDKVEISINNKRHEIKLPDGDKKGTSTSIKVNL